MHESTNEYTINFNFGRFYAGTRYGHRVGGQCDFFKKPDSNCSQSERLSRL
jgi:hypothetical protein